MPCVPSQHEVAVDALQLGDQHADVVARAPASPTPSSFSTDMQNAMLLDCALR